MIAHQPKPVSKMTWSVTTRRKLRCRAGARIAVAKNGWSMLVRNEPGLGYYGSFLCCEEPGGRFLCGEEPGGGVRLNKLVVTVEELCEAFLMTIHWS